MAGVTSILDSIDTLPALPASAARVVLMLSDDRADLKQIADVVRLDEALSMTVLRYANSVQYGRPGRTFDLKESVVRLGGDLMVKIVLQQQVGPLLLTGGASFGLERGAMWRGAVGGAFAAEALSRKHGLDESGLSFLCGLMRDVGKLALDARYGADYERSVSEQLDESRTFVEAERIVFGTDHAEIGAELALRWQLPSRIADAIRYHHQPPEAAPEHDTLFDVVHAADILCLWGGLAIGHDGLQYRLAPHVRTGLALSRSEAEGEITAMWGKLRQSEEAMSGSKSERRSA